MNYQCDLSSRTSFTILSCNQAAGRFLILSHFYGFLILRSEQVAGTYSVALRKMANIRTAGGPMALYICVFMYMYVCMCMHMYRSAANNQ